ncbi:hypothetical protein JCGZ_14764 [Jatropha curcas]|uniref:Uncharacterized protein n=1 Tax=Jatropha curcas TaxID=180498 RepID=A0A067K8V1_JATCU|nr:hypothetical protein JCGZ_14764 [Jatropha curcas]
MVIKNFNLEPVQKDSTALWQDFNDDDDEDESLSFSDLPLNNNSSVNHWDDDFSKELDQSQDFFEFFSEDFSISSATYPTGADNIIFCGKLIPYKEENKVSHQNFVRNQEITSYTPNGRKKSQSFDISSRTNSLKKLQQEKYYKNCKSFPENDTYGFGFPRKKSSCYLFGRFPTTEMELRDIKKRQRKRLPMAKMFQSDNRSETVENGRRKKAKSLWGFLRVFACKSHQSNNIVKNGSNSPVECN